MKAITVMVDNVPMALTGTISNFEFASLFMGEVTDMNGNPFDKKEYIRDVYINLTTYRYDDEIEKLTLGNKDLSILLLFSKALEQNDPSIQENIINYYAEVTGKAVTTGDVNALINANIADTVQKVINTSTKKYKTLNTLRECNIDDTEDYNVIIQRLSAITAGS